jgi:hypothetical protein
LFGRQLPHLSFDGFELAHGDSVPLGAREVKAQVTASHRCQPHSESRSGVAISFSLSPRGHRER